MLPPASALPLWAYPVLAATGLVAGTVDALAGGGGLITLPALLACGLPAPQALATSKLQGTFGSGSAAWSFARRGAVNLRDCRLGFALTAAGAVGGAFTVRWLDPQFLGALIPWLLGAIVVYMIFRPKLGETSRHHRLEAVPFYVLFGLVLGFYDGFFGPGVGSFWTIAFVTTLGHDFVRAAGHTKVMNFASNLAALAFFAVAGTVVWLPGLAMGAGQLLGGRLGAHLAMTRGARFVRPIFLVMASLVAAKLIYASLTRTS
ncbi:MAG: TSUP family transporter [bacterium]|nr:TSUP family transporter [bacterium]MDI1337165.1 TSUP family transporter [Lacunisphaera sp.]